MFSCEFIRALKCVVRNVVTVIQSSAPYDAGTTTGDVDLDVENGFFQKITLTGATVAREFNPPSNGVEGNWLTVLVTSVAGVSRTLALDAAIVVPSDSEITFPKTLDDGGTYVLRLYHNGTAWWLVTLVGGYA